MFVYQGGSEMIGLKSVLGVGLALIVGGFLIVQAEASPLTRAADSLAMLKTYSQLHQAGCVFGTSRCPKGTKWICSKSGAGAGVTKKCYCRTC
ncbi:MAG: hypothetical protein R6X03_10640 [Methyloceanibacter sp.]